MADFSALNGNIAAYKDGSAEFDVAAGTTGSAVFDDAGSAPLMPEPDTYHRGTILSVDSEKTVDAGGVAVTYRTYSVKLRESGDTVQVTENDLDSVMKAANLKPGAGVALVRSSAFGDPEYHVADLYRLPALGWILVVFLVAAAAFGRKRGITAVLGLAFTVGIIVLWALPAIGSGAPAFGTLVLASVAIVVVAIALAHGWNERTALAIAASLGVLGVTVGMEWAFVHMASLFGYGSEEAMFLSAAGLANVDPRGLLLGGILLGTTGVLDDITTAQVAVVAELKSANQAFRFADLFARASVVGREHIASLVNTLFLAYAGTSLALLLLFSAHTGQPAWFILNSEMVAEEAVRALVGSIALVLAVPVATALAAWWYDRHTPAASSQTPHTHAH